MKIFTETRERLQNLRWMQHVTNANGTDSFHSISKRVKAILQDQAIPAALRHELKTEFNAIREINDKLDKAELHIAFLGRVSVGKSSLINALLGQKLFSTSVLHGETRHEQRAHWSAAQLDNVYIIDTPGIDELDGEEREQMALAIGQRADIIVFVCAADLTQVEMDCLHQLSQLPAQLLLVLNKQDQYTDAERTRLIQRLQQRTHSFLAGDNIVSVSAVGQTIPVLTTDPAGRETHSTRHLPADVEALRSKLWAILDEHGLELIAMNAVLFTQTLDRQLARRITEIRARAAVKLCKRYALLKSLLVAANPIPIADLVSAASLDLSLVIHMGRIYGYQPARKEALKLLGTITANLALASGAYWGTNLIASSLKAVSAGFSTTFTVGAQAGLAYYATMLTGQAAEYYYAQDRSWGEHGPKAILRELRARQKEQAALESAKPL